MTTLLLLFKLMCAPDYCSADMEKMDIAPRLPVSEALIVYVPEEYDL